MTIFTLYLVRGMAIVIKENVHSGQIKELQKTISLLWLHHQLEVEENFPQQGYYVPWIMCLEVVQMVLGKNFCFSSNQTRENTDISFHFLASLLDLNLPKLCYLLLLRMVFKATILVNDVYVLVVVQLGVGLPWLDDIDRMFLQGVEVVWHPFIPNMNFEGLERHKHWVTISYNFLCQRLGLNEATCIQWCHDFIELVESTRFYDEGD